VTRGRTNDARSAAHAANENANQF